MRCMQALFPANGSPWSADFEQSLGTGDLVSAVCLQCVSMPVGDPSGHTTAAALYRDTALHRPKAS